MSRYGISQSRSVIQDDVTVIGGDIIGSDADKDTKLTLQDSRAKVVVDNQTKIDVQPNQIDLGVGVGPGLKIDANGKAVFSLPFASVTSGDSPRAVTAADAVLAVNTAAGPVTLNLPAANSVDAGRYFIICDLGSAATNAITIASSGYTIGGAASVTLNQNRQQVTVLSTSTEWLLF